MPNAFDFFAFPGDIHTQDKCFGAYRHGKTVCSEMPRPWLLPVTRASDEITGVHHSKLLLTYSDVAVELICDSRAKPKLLKLSGTSRKCSELVLTLR
jgi:hypothetical protein